MKLESPSHLMTLFVSILLLKPLQRTTLPSCVPIAVLSAVHMGPGASKATSDDAGGLEPCIAHGARVMLSANLWVEVGLVNGALGTVEAIYYEGDQRPPNLPIAVTVKFDSYSGPTLPDGTVPITPLRRT